MNTKILCLTRGGEASYPNQDGAIAIAKERGQDMMFLYISNIEFLDRTAAPKVIDIETELDELGKFLLTMAQERANNAGVTAKTLVRRGVFREVLSDVIEENNFETVILGSSSDDTGLIDMDLLHEVTCEVQQKYEIEFIILYEGEIIKTYQVETGAETEKEEYEDE
jgi:nucleotide-binding universal stress UspA family protein